MNQTEECATKRVFGVIIWYDNVVGKRLLDFFAGSAFSQVAGLSQGGWNSIPQCFAYHSYYRSCALKFDQSEVLHEREGRSCDVGLK